MVNVVEILQKVKIEKTNKKKAASLWIDQMFPEGKNSLLSRFGDRDGESWINNFSGEELECRVRKKLAQGQRKPDEYGKYRTIDGNSSGMVKAKYTRSGTERRQGKTSLAQEVRQKNDISECRSKGWG